MNNFFVIIEFEFRALWNDKPGLIRMFIEPIAYLFLLTAGLSGIISQNMDQSTYISFVYPGIVALQSFRTFSHSIYRLTIDRRWGLQALKMVAGTTKYAYLFGNAIVPICLCIIQIGFTYPCAIILGVSPSSTGILLLTLVGIVVALFWTSLATILTFYFKNYSQRDFVISSLFLPISLSAPIFYSLDNAPKYLQIISLLNPLSYQVDAMRTAFLQHTLSISFYIVLGITLLFYAIALKILSKSEFLPSETG